MTKNLDIPILIFTYKRLKLLKNLISSLKKNNEYSEYKLYIFIDGPKKHQDILKISKIKNYCHTISGFKCIKIIKRKKNFGLAKNIINGVTQVLRSFKCAIILEDDLVVGRYFLNYMNTALNKYKNYKKIWHVCAWSQCPSYLSIFFFMMFI